jgi:Kef-type K+ transport system membrane component KefB
MGNLVAFVFLKHDPYSTALFGIAVVFVAAWVFGAVFARFGQPRVIGEVIAGLVLGPSVLGSLSTHLFPVWERPTLGVLAQLAVSIFMFFVGLEMNFGKLRQAGHNRVAAIVTGSNIAVPFVIGIGVALVLHSSYQHVKLSTFCLFIGVALSITAFPVLARIVQERRIDQRPLGSLSLLIAAGSDVLTWAILILVLSVAAASSGVEVIWFVALALVFALVMILPVRRGLARYSNSQITIESLLLVLAGILLCATFTAVIGFHEIFGAFMFGAVFPRGALATKVSSMVEPIGRALLPIFFISTGLLVNIHSIGSQGWWQLILIVAAACIGKIGGVTAGARGAGLALRDAAGLGALMNTRGLTELIVLTIGLQSHILDTKLFTIFVLMSVLTTMATGPLLSWIRPDPDLGLRSEKEAQEITALASDDPPGGQGPQPTSPV